MTASTPLTKIQSGLLEGVALPGVDAYFGIPYAAPPTGVNRGRAPQAVAPWSGARRADAMGPTAPKGKYAAPYRAIFPEVDIAGDDSLNLNVWAPAGAKRDSHPVLVWIHGGSFMNGSGSLPEYDGAAFARSGVVCVTINYRLGAEGFLHLDDGVANLGLLDQLAALRWVQENITSFGGDPMRVTVAGESAGAMSIASLLASPLAKGLFARAILQSGACANTLSRDEARTVARHFAAALGVAPTFAALMALPVDALVAASAKLVADVQRVPNPAKWGRLALSLLPFAPAVDGVVLPEPPLAAIAAGRGLNVDLMIGTNRDEWRLFTVAPGVIDRIDEATLSASARAYGLTPAGVDVYRARRPDATPGDLLAAIVTDWYFTIPVVRVAEARASVGSGTTWLYRFDYPSIADNHGLGACHGAELPFVFDTIGLETLRPRIGNSPSPTVARTMHETWVTFITDGAAPWSPFDLTDRAVGILGDGVRETLDPARDERLLWDRIRESDSAQR